MCELNRFMQMDLASFKTFMNSELKEYVQKQMAKAAGRVHVHVICVRLWGKNARIFLACRTKTRNVVNVESCNEVRGA